ncbi:MAG: CvpA family protein [Betaproteobacteria bacterium]
MNGLDLAIIAIFLLSVLFAFVRGFTRQIIALFSWVLGFLAAVTLSPSLGNLFPDFGSHPTLRYLIAFGIIMIAALILGGLIAWPLRDLLRRSGMGFLDRFLGGLFGVVRGVVLMLVLTLVSGLTTLPQQDWWQNSYLAPILVGSAVQLEPWLPQEWSERLDFSRDGRNLPVSPAERKV